MAERVRAGGAGIYAFYTKTGAGTLVAEGKETRIVDGETFVLETGIVADVSLVKAWKGDTRATSSIARRPAISIRTWPTAGRITVAEVEELVEPGMLDPDAIHTPGIYVQRIIDGSPYNKLIEKRTLRKREDSHAVVS